ncbi:MAG TPA: protein phosphatase CheZ [Alphaproteobacteria bacterium]|nr:protein phosphatase CheZ [Alphaproteobacteria bacterium]
MADMNDTKLRQEVLNLFQYIERLRSEVATMSKSEDDATAFDDMSAQLDAIVNATEEATNSILSASESISGDAMALQDESDPGKTREMADRISQNAMKIMEACSFQDLTGQRVSKIVSSVKFVEDRVNQMIELWGREEIEQLSAEMCTKEPEDPDKKLLNGPQLPGQAISQDDIDALFD